MEPRNCSSRRRSKSSLSAPLSASPVGSPIAAPFDPPNILNFSPEPPQVRSKSQLHPGNAGLNAFFATIRRMTQARLSYTDQIAFLVNVISSGKSQLRNVDEDVLATRSNLNSVVPSGPLLPFRFRHQRV